MILTIGLRASRWRQRGLIITAAALVILAAIVLWRAVNGWWGDYVWVWPLLLGALWLVVKLSRYGVELICWDGLSGASHAGERRVVLRCEEAEHRHSAARDCLCIEQGLLLPWLVIIKVRADDSSCRWCWVYRDQVNEAGWARLRRVARQPHSLSAQHS